jgi:hypothetical protein
MHANPVFLSDYSSIILLKSIRAPAPRIVAASIEDAEFTGRLRFLRSREIRLQPRRFREIRRACDGARGCSVDRSAY